MSLTSTTSGSTYTGTTDSSASKASFSHSLSPTQTMSISSTPPSFSPSPLPFANRRANIKFSSARYYPPPRSLRGSKRGRSGMSSFRSTRRTAPRPTRTKGVFDSLLIGLTDGIEAVKRCIEDMKKKLHGTNTRVNYYRELEKQIKSLERRVRTLEVHKDRIEEMRDEYALKIKLREGAFNLAQALASQSSKAAKEKLTEARAEQRDLLEDLCDIEDELETKLGVFKVHINGLVGHNKIGSNDSIETQFKLGSQKWKAKCKMSRHEQLWQDEDIIFLGKVADEMFVKVVEVKKIQGNTHVGSVRCLTRDFFSFCPLNVTFHFPSSAVKLNMDVKWCPTIGEDFLSDLDLQPINCVVGGAHKSPSRASSAGNIERLHSYTDDTYISGAGPNVRQIRIVTESDSETRSSNSYGRSEVKTHSVSRRHKKKTKEETDFVFLDRKSIISNADHLRDYPEAKRLIEKESSPSSEPASLVNQTRELNISSSSPQQPGRQPLPLKQLTQKLRTDTYNGSLGSSNSSGSAHSGGSGSSLTRQPYSHQRSTETITLLSMLDAVFVALDEPKELYPELKALEHQLSRLEVALKGGELIKAPSMTLSESQAMEDFEFLGSDDNLLLPSRYSRASFVETPEDQRSSSYSQSTYPRSNSSNATPTVSVSDSLEGCQSSFDSHTDEMFSSSASETSGGCVHQSTGVESVDKVLIQHLIHCECLLQHLQSAGPLKHKLSSGLAKLQQESQVISELLNIAAEPESPPQIEHILPELAANEQLMRFWKSITKDGTLSIKHEQFIIGLDERFGQNLWIDFPETATKVFTELISRVLDLEIEDWEPLDGQMVVTVFQYAAYFLSHGSIQKCLMEIAQELNITEGLQSNEADAAHRIASQLSEYGYNRGALLAAALLLADSDTRVQTGGGNYIEKFAGNSPWHNKAVQYFIELLEHADQKVRAGACTALGRLQAKVAVSQLKYLARRDFAHVRESAAMALEMMGESALSHDGKSRPALKQSITPDTHRKHSPIQRTRSAELILSSES